MTAHPKTRLRSPRVLYALLCAALLAGGGPIGATRWDCQKTGARDQVKCCCNPSSCRMSHCDSRAGSKGRALASSRPVRTPSTAATETACCTARYDSVDPGAQLSRSDRGLDATPSTAAQAGAGLTAPGHERFGEFVGESPPPAVPLHLLHRVLLC